MAKEEEKITVDGTIIEALPGTQFRVKLDNGHEVMAYLSGRMRRYYIRTLRPDPRPDHLASQLAGPPARARVTRRMGMECRRDESTSLSEEDVPIVPYHSAPGRSPGHLPEGPEAQATSGLVADAEVT